MFSHQYLERKSPWITLCPLSVTSRILICWKVIERWNPLKHVRSSEKKRKRNRQRIRRSSDETAYRSFHVNLRKRRIIRRSGLMRQSRYVLTSEDLRIEKNKLPRYRGTVLLFTRPQRKPEEINCNIIPPKGGNCLFYWGVFFFNPVLYLVPFVSAIAFSLYALSIFTYVTKLKRLLRCQVVGENLIKTL